MEEFNEKVREILQTHKHLEEHDWQYICHAMYLKYKYELISKESYKKYLDLYCKS